jgi:hypothetical protein
MKLHYIGILRNESKPAHEIVAEKELSAYSRFTRNKFVEPRPRPALALFASTASPPFLTTALAMASS